MTNFERYKDEILKFSTRGDAEIPAIVNGKPVSCDNTRCDDCELAGYAACAAEIAGAKKHDSNRD